MKRRIDNNVLGALLLTFSWLFFTTEMVSVRMLADYFSMSQIVVFRLAIQIIIFSPVLIVTSFTVLKTRKISLHIARATFSILGMLLFYLAFAKLPLALTTTLTFTQAMFVTILAATFLKERIGRRSTLAVIIGFLGVLIVIRPGFEAFDPNIFIALTGALAAAFLMIITRNLALTESRMTIMLYSALIGMLIIIAPAAMNWVPIRNEDWALLFLIGISGTTGQFLMVGAFQLAEASTLAPVDYIRLIFALVAGYIMFNEIPEFWTWVGAFIVVGSVVFATNSERNLKSSSKMEN